MAKRYELTEAQFETIRELLPERYGKWKSTHKRFSRWAQNGVWEAVFTRLLKDPPE